MKKCNPFFFFILLIICSLPTAAQQTEQPVKFLKGGFVTGNNIRNRNFNANDLQPSLFEGRYFVLVQFDGLPTLATKGSLKNTGLELGDYLPGNAYLATIKNDLNFSALLQFNVLSVNPIPQFYKTDTRLTDYTPVNAKEGGALFAVN